ncbi:MAG: hypothetical protein OEY85_04530, partial [Rhodospirillales bacterium]|nr:hypothetical protein [Rhodospirillales bacterium]
NSILPHHQITIFETVLDERSVDHWRHWFKESVAFGFKDGRGKIHWVPNEQYKIVALGIQKIAIMFGKTEDVPMGKSVTFRINPHNEIN